MESPLHILVVDDRPDSVLFLTEFLLSRRHRVETCSNGAEGLEAVVRRNRTADAYDLLISDVSMPAMDGLTLVREIRRRQMLLPIALYTGYGSLYPHLNQQAEQLGCMMVLDKPIELRRVESLLEDVWAKRTGSRRQEKDQPFFGTSRVARSSTTTTYRRETSQPTDLETSQIGGNALEPKQVIPMPPMPSRNAPTPQAPPPLPRIPAPLRTPLPFPLEQQEPHTRSMPSFRTPLPQDQREGTGRTVKPAFRTPLPFLQPGAVLPRPTPIPIAPPVRSTPVPSPPAKTPGSEKTAAPTQPVAGQTTSFIRRGVMPPPKNQGTGHTRRPSDGLAQNNPTTGEAAPVNPVGTARIRRTVTGSYMPPPLPTSQGNSQERPPVSASGATRAVACAHCGKVFMVLSKPASYTAVCVHCGQLNRIDPL